MRFEGENGDDEDEDEQCTMYSRDCVGMKEETATRKHVKKVKRAWAWLIGWLRMRAS
jgi:hypothetical protein